MAITGRLNIDVHLVDKIKSSIVFENAYLKINDCGVNSNNRIFQVEVFSNEANRLSGRAPLNLFYLNDMDSSASVEDAYAFLKNYNEFRLFQDC